MPAWKSLGGTWVPLNKAAKLLPLAKDAITAGKIAAKDLLDEADQTQKKVVEISESLHKKAEKIKKKADKISKE